MRNNTNKKITKTTKSTNKLNIKLNKTTLFYIYIKNTYCLDSHFDFRCYVMTQAYGFTVTVSSYAHHISCDSCISKQSKTKSNRRILLQQQQTRKLDM